MASRYLYNPCRTCCNPDCNGTNTKITGKVTYQCAASQAGVTVTASGPATLTTTTDSSGNYSFDIVKKGVYTVTVTTACSSQTQSVLVDKSSCAIITANVNFTIPGYTLQVNANSTCVSPVLTAYYGVRANDPNPPRPALPASFPWNGCYQAGDVVTLKVINDPCYEDGTYTFTMGCANQTTTINLVAKKYSISGTVTGCAALPGATVTASGGGTASTTTDSSGNFTLSNMSAQCPYVITVSKTRFVTGTFSSTMPCNDVTGVGYSLAVASGYQCWGCCQLPLIEPLTIVDSQGSHNIRFASGIFVSDCAVKPGVTGSDRNTTSNACQGPPITVSVAYYYTIACNISTKKWTVQRNMPVCFNGNVIDSICSPTTGFPVASSFPLLTFYGGESVVQDSPYGSCSPLSLSFNFSFGFADTATLTG